MNKNRKFSNFLLFPALQLKFVLISILASLFTIGLAAWQIHESFSYLRQTGEKLQLPANSAYFKLINAQELLIYKNILLALGAGLVIALLVNLVITHKALGPFYRLKVFFENYSRGSGKKIQFRSGDYFKRLEDTINKHLD